MNKLQKAAVVLTGVLVAVLGFTQPTYAAPPDPTDGAMASIQGDLSGWVTTYGLPALVVLLTLGLVVGILIRFAKRGAKTVTG